MNPCTRCRHFRSCLERRGVCTDYAEIKQREVIADIERINKAYRAEAAGNQSGVQEAPETSERLREIHQDIAVQL